MRGRFLALAIFITFRRLAADDERDARRCWRSQGRARPELPSMPSPRAIATVVGVLLVRTSGPRAGRSAAPSANGVDPRLGALPARLRAQGARLEAAVRRRASDRRRWRSPRQEGQRPVTGIALPTAASTSSCASRSCVATPARAPGVGGVCLSLLLLGLIDSAALAPLAAHLGRRRRDDRTVPRPALFVVAGAGIAAAARRAPAPDDGAAPTGSPASGSLAGSASTPRSPREASKAWALVSLSWLVRGAALFVLLDALALDASIPLALAFLCASAAAAALPIAPAGAATQAGAGAAMLVASGVGASQAVAFAVAAQGLAIMMGALILLAAGLWQASLRSPRPASSRRRRDVATCRRLRARCLSNRLLRGSRAALHCPAGVRHALRQAPARPRRPRAARAGSTRRRSRRRCARSASRCSRPTSTSRSSRTSSRRSERAIGQDVLKSLDARPAGREDRPRGADGADGHRRLAARVRAGRRP